MIILDKPISLAELSAMAANFYVDMVKGVADVKTGRLALDAELHSDLERILLESGSCQEDLWGFNLYPEADDEDFIEYDSLINIRPRQNNMSRNVENEDIQGKIKTIVNNFIKQ